MKKIQNYARRSPIVFSTGLMLGFIILNVVVGRLFSLIPSGTVTDIIYELIYIAWPAALAVSLGYGFIYRQKGFFSTLGAGLLVLLLYGLMAVAVFAGTAANPELQWKGPLECVLGVVMLIGVGFREESLFRGIVLNSIARKYGSDIRGIWITLLASGAIFGALHIGNVFNGVSFLPALIQSMSAAALGVYFGAVYLRGGSIWGIALLHTIFNTPGTVEALFANGGSLATVINGVNIASLIPVPVFLLLTAFLLRKSKRQKVLDRLNAFRSEID